MADLRVQENLRPGTLPKPGIAGMRFDNLVEFHLQFARRCFAGRAHKLPVAV
jgi:hypothetical protein